MNSASITKGTFGSVRLSLAQGIPSLRGGPWSAGIPCEGKNDQLHAAGALFHFPRLPPNMIFHRFSFGGWKTWMREVAERALREKKQNTQTQATIFVCYTQPSILQIRDFEPLNQSH